MSFQITPAEREAVERFKGLKYPAIYKLDDTLNILFVETVDFDVCTMLLKGKPLKQARCREILNEYHEYLSQVRTSSFDAYARIHYELLLQVMDIFEKYYRSSCS